MSYDFEEIEQQFMQEFVQNRPLILAEHLRFEYIREAHNLDIFEQIRQIVQQVINFTHTITHIRYHLIGFL